MFDRIASRRGRLWPLPKRRGSASVARWEIHVAISPTPRFLTQVHYLAVSLRHFGGELAESPVIVTVGGDEQVDLAHTCRWSSALGVEWRWLDDALWRRYGIYATALQRFCYDIEASNALLLDADTLCVAAVDDLLDTVESSGAIAGSIAHISPFTGCENEQDLWRRIFHGAGLGDPSLECEHTGWQTIEFDAARHYCPPYFNLGVLLAPRAVLAELAESIYTEMETVERVHPSFFRCQIALTLAIVRSGVRWRELPLRFNLPNDVRFLPRDQVELDDARIIHYLRDEDFDRAQEFTSVEGVGSLLSRDDLNPINTRLRDALREIHERVLAET